MGKHSKPENEIEIKQTGITDRLSTVDTLKQGEITIDQVGFDE